MQTRIIIISQAGVLSYEHDGVTLLKSTYICKKKLQQKCKWIQILWWNAMYSSNLRDNNSLGQIQPRTIEIKACKKIVWGKNLSGKASTGMSAFRFVGRLCGFIVLHLLCGKIHPTYTSLFKGYSGYHIETNRDAWFWSKIRDLKMRIFDLICYTQRFCEVRNTRLVLE